MPCIHCMCTRKLKDLCNIFEYILIGTSSFVIGVLNSRCFTVLSGNANNPNSVRSIS